MAQSGPFKDFYKTLGVNADASDDEITRAYRSLARELHSDVNPDPAVQGRMREVAEAYEGLGGGFGKGDGRQRKRGEYDEIYNLQRRVAVEQGPVIRIPENDLGLLAALMQAYATNDANKWDVKKSELEDREWMPENVFQVRRDERGRVTVLRTVKDWRLSHDREDPIKPIKEGTLTTPDEKTFRPDIRLGEYYLYGNGVLGVYQPYNYKEYLDAIKSLAQKLRETGTPDVRKEAEILELNTKYGLREGERRTSANTNDPLVRDIPLIYLQEEVRKAEGRVISIMPKGKEGQQQRSETEGPQAGQMVESAEVQRMPEGNIAGEAKG